jgi:lauroyl/myristoyl acyltransferase
MNGGMVSITAGAWEGLKVNRAPFLGGALPLATGAPALAHATGAALLPLFTVRQKVGAPICTIIERPIAIAAGGSRSKAIAEANRQYVLRLEPHVLAHPDQWRGWHYLGAGLHAFITQDGDVPQADHRAIAAED